MKLIKDNKKGKTYQCDGFKLLYRYQGSLSGDNDVNPYERIYLVEGTAMITILDKIETYEAPAQVIIPANTYHSIEAMSDIALLIFDS